MSSVRPSRSITRDALLTMGLRLTLLMAVMSGAVYWQLQRTITDETTIQLRDYATERLAREQALFTAAHNNLATFRQQLTAALAVPLPDVDARFAAIARVAPDGTLRAHEGIDHTKEPQLFAGPQTTVDAATKQLYVVGWDMVRDYGRAWHAQFQDTYITTPRNGMVLYWPEVPDWGTTAKADLDMRLEPYVFAADVEHNPNRTAAWTPLYFDKVAKAWMVSAVEPVDINGVHVASVGQDLLLNEVVARTINVHIPGAHNVIFNGAGKLVAHTDFTAAIEDKGGDFSMLEAHSPELTALFALAQNNGTTTTVGALDDDNLVALGHIDGPDWYLAVVYPRALIASRALGAVRFVFLLSLAALVLQLAVLFFVLKHKVAGPLQDLTRSAEHVRAGNFDTRVEVRRDDELGALATSFNAMTTAIAERDDRLAKHAASLESTVAERTTALNERNQHMRLVLDHVRQGLLVVTADGALPPERALVLEEWLGVPAENDTLSTWLSRADHRAGCSLQLGLDAIVDDFLPLELLLDQLPRRAVAHGRSLQLEYQHIGGSGAAAKVLVVISDATATLLHERAEAEQRDLVRLFVKLRNDASGVANFIDEGSRMVAQLDNATDLKATLRAVHTLKGNAAIFGQDVIAAACHRLEDTAADAGVLEPEAVEMLKQSWTRLLERARSIQGDGDSTDVNASDLDAIIAAIEHGEPVAAILEHLKGLRHERVDAQLTRIADQATAIAARLGKRVECYVEAGRLRLDHDVAGPVFSALVHAVRNAVDHGIEHPEVREAAGKPQVGRLELRAVVERNVLVLSVKDDGAGVNWDAVQRKAHSLGLPSATPHELEDALFADGVSTRSEVTILSGRGVGMSAIRAEARARGGDARVLSVAGQGTTLVVRVPLASTRVALAS